MNRRSVPWVGEEDVALLTDLYELTMAQAYWRDGRNEPAVFSLFVRTLPRVRNYLLACGVADALALLETFRFSQEALEYLEGTGRFARDFLDWLAELRFTGDVHAVPDGTPVFANEPIMEVEAPLIEAQIVETILMNQVQVQTLLASKAARVVRAAAGRQVVDFGLRRAQGADAGLKGARAFWVAGVDATSNVLAGKVYGMPIAGTMAHSYVQSFDHELDAFRAFARVYPETILLVDTYDTLEGVRHVVQLARELGDDFRVRAIRLDSGDLAELAFRAREILDEAGLERVEIFASGGLDEYRVAEIVARGAPITGFGVGTSMAVASDAPAMDVAYKLTEYAGRGRLKLSPGKQLLPGRKQVFRMEEGGRAVRDVMARRDEELEGRPLLRPAMAGGRVIDESFLDLALARERAREEIAKLPDRIQALEPAEPRYPVEVSEALRAYGEEVGETVG